MVLDKFGRQESHGTKLVTILSGDVRASNKAERSFMLRSRFTNLKDGCDRLKKKIRSCMICHDVTHHVVIRRKRNILVECKNNSRRTEVGLFKMVKICGRKKKKKGLGWKAGLLKLTGQGHGKRDEEKKRET